MKKIILIILIFFFTLNKSTIRKQDLHNIIKGYIEYVSKKRKVDNNKEILAVVVHTQMKDEEQQYSVDVAFFEPEFMERTQYKNVYMFEGYKLILPNNECEAIEKMFKKVKYENFNQKKTIINYDFKNWHVVLNKKNEITFLSPIPISGCMKSILMNKKLKFSDSYEDITFSNPSADCSTFTH